MIASVCVCAGPIDGEEWCENGYHTCTLYWTYVCNTNMDKFLHHKLGFCPSIIDARVEKLVRVFDSLKTMGFTPQNHQGEVGG